LKALIEIARGLCNGRVRALLGAALSAPAAELIESMFVSTELRGAYASMASILGSITQDSSGIGLFATAPLHRYGVVRPVGGMQAIPDALQRCLVEHGGDVRIRSRAQSIEIEGGVVRAVRLADGTSLQANFVVTAVPPHIVSELLDADRSTDAGALRHAPANAAGIGCFKVDVALNRHVSPTVHQTQRPDRIDLRKPTLFYGSLEQVLRAEAEARVGMFPTVPPWTATILSATDPTQAPEGQDTLYLYSPAPIRPHEGWGTARVGAEQKLLNSAAAVFGDMGRFEIGRLSETPEDLEHRLGAKNGCIYHIDHVVTRIGPLRPARGWAGHRTRISGLFLSGAGTHPGGGVSGLPGQLAAQALLHSTR
jgi:phytoene dehydrogenase-like protein